MSVHEAVEAIFVTVPDMPDERALVEQLTVLFEEAITQPVVEARAASLCTSNLMSTPLFQASPKATASS